ncbi:MAG: hypothetical protein ACFFD4_28350 [Candidatus Odinarchaeota archaeon]
MKNTNIRMVLKTAGVSGWIIGIIAFLISLSYMSDAVTFGSLGYLAETNFFGLLGVTFFISGTIMYLKSLDFIDL